jgi:hypothetical protein
MADDAKGAISVEWRGLAAGVIWLESEFEQVAHYA